MSKKSIIGEKQTEIFTEELKDPKQSGNSFKIIMPSIEEMLQAGVHFGHKTSKWHPKVESYIFTTRNNIHIIDLEKTQFFLKKALEFVAELASKNSIILFVGTKSAAKNIIKEEAIACGMPYVNERWLGGTLTNFKTISKRIEYYNTLEEKKNKGELEKYTKKERVGFEKKLKKLAINLEGIRTIKSLPEALFIAGVKEDYLAAKEAKIVKTPIIALCDTNTDPTFIDKPIPSNDDSNLALQLMIHAVAETIKANRPDGVSESELK